MLDVFVYWLWLDFSCYFAWEVYEELVCDGDVLVHLVWTDVFGYVVDVSLFVLHLGGLCEERALCMYEQMMEQQLARCLAWIRYFIG